MVGKLLAHFQILETLGAGGMGVVYKARDTHLGRLVAIKILSAESISNPAPLSRPARIQNRFLGKSSQPGSYT